MSLLSGVIVTEEDAEVDVRLSSSAQPTRVASVKAVRHERIKVEGRVEVAF
jgi:hypothetical protein